jgi:amyloid beta precursor protein binding protein 1
MQRALMESKICLLNAGATGTETLKNLVLPGCGYIVVVDGGVVTERDLSSNFFVSREHLGQPRAKVREPPRYQTTICLGVVLCR